MNPMDFLARIHSAPPVAPTNLPTGSIGFSMLSEGKSSKDDDEEEEEETEIKLSSGDCNTEREKAEKLRSRKRKKENPLPTVYIPECTPEGKYKELQCYQSFCWCVDLDSGLPMKVSGSSSTNATHPDCSQKKAVRKGKECPYEQKLVFLKRLTNIFQREMVESKLRSLRRKQQESVFRSRSNRPTNNQGRQIPLPSQIKLPNKHQFLNWKFNQIDKNHDHSVNETEWKAFRRSLKNVRKQNVSFREIRHCFKLFFGGCDTNRDKEVSQEEWFGCTGLDLSFEEAEDEPAFSSLSSPQRTQRMSPSYSSSSLARKRRKKRPNPFATILKAD
jgi:hypothetical protein